MAVSAALVAASGAAAAADVQIYGRVNTALFFQKVQSEDHAKLRMDNGASRFGLNISETLTDDLSVRGYLENGFNSDDGGLTNTSGGASSGSSMLFDRRSIIALRSNKAGEFGFGRMGTVRSTMAPYGIGLAALDPFETAYAVDCSISGVFGNDARGNNSISWLSPKWAGWQTGLTYSLSTTGQEDEDMGDNNRQLAGVLAYSAGPLYVTAGTTYQWFGHDPNVAPTDADQGKKYQRNDAQVWMLGATYQMLDNLKLFAAAQWHKDWRNVGGWNVDRWYRGNPADAKAGIDGVTALVGLQYWPAAKVRVLADYMYFDGEHDMETGSVDAKRHVVNGALEYWFSKKTHAFVSLSYSTGSGALDSDATFEHFNGSANDVNRVSSYLGLEMRF